MKPSVGCFVQATCGFNGSPSRGHNFAGELGSYCGPKNTFDYSWPLVYGRQRNEWFEDNVCTGTGNMLGPLMTGQPLLDQGRVRRNLVSTCLSGHKIIFSHFFLLNISLPTFCIFSSSKTILLAFNVRPTSVYGVCLYRVYWQWLVRLGSRATMLSKAKI